ncbi:hypothetical protein BV898_13317 [Hypsibius exemplaris]|uniref:Protein kinase domain-containing protein n=1 Tax=Hypsibius exemplaris TaxID=2072580 RepID=A0A1W0WB66_HYPEX|nr:hypothetical protein BV898_13317 [Hypsibius exemplaris]
METLSPIILKPAFITLLKGIGDCARRIDSGHQLWGCKREFDANIESLCGNGNAKLLLNIENFVRATSEQTRDTILMSMLRDQIHGDFRAVSDAVTESEKKYNQFKKNPGQFTWSEFQSHGNVDAQLSRLHRQITIHSGQQSNLVDAIVKACEMDFNLFNEWSQAIFLLVERAFRIRMEFHYYNVFKDEAYEPGAGQRAVMEDVVFPQYVLDEKVLMDQEVAEIQKQMETKYREMKASFLLRNCGDTRHNHHCGGGLHGCWELSTKVYRAVRLSGDLSHSALATKIASRLRSDYPQFLWSAVVLTDYRQAALEANNARHDQDLWLQHFGSKKPILLCKPNRHSDNLCKAFGRFGYLTCFRNRYFSNRSAHIFWVDPDAIQNTAFLEEFDKLRNTDIECREFKEVNSSRPAYFVPKRLIEMNIACVYGVGFHVKAGEQRIGMDLNEFGGGRTFPLCLGNDSRCVMVIPDPSQSSPPAEYPISPAYFTALFTGGGKKPRVHKEHQPRGLAEQLVVVKEILLSKNKPGKRSRQILKLNCHLAHLKDFKHENLVKYIGFEVGSGCGLPTYKIITEFCEGGTLSDRIQSAVAEINIFQWSCGILNGLQYLHQNDIHHKSLESDHVMFDAPAPKISNIKLISVERIAEIIPKKKKCLVAAIEKDHSGPNPLTRSAFSLKYGVSATTIARVISQDLEGKVRKKCRVHALSNKQAKQRLDRGPRFLRYINARKWKNVITIDEAWVYLIDVNRIRKIYYDFRGERSPESWTIFWKESHPKDIIFVAGVCSRCKTAIRFVKPGAKINSEYYIQHVLKPLFKNDIRNLFPGELINKVVSHHDSAPAHSSKITQEWLRKSGIKFIPKEYWMGDSPDLAPWVFVWMVC